MVVKALMLNGAWWPTGCTTSLSNHRQVPHGALVPRDCLGAFVVDALQPGNEPGQAVLGEDGACLLFAAEGKPDPSRGQVAHGIVCAVINLYELFALGHVLQGGQFGQFPDDVVLGLQPVQSLLVQP